MINLLPTQQKNEIEREEKCKVILILGISVLISFLSTFLILSIIQIYIFGQLESKKNFLELEEKRLEDPVIKDIQERVVLLNQSILKLDSFYQSQAELTGTLEKISQAIPPGIYLTNLSWQKENSELKIVGFASQREDLFHLKENLEKENFFSDVNFSPTSWVRPKEVNFQVTLKVGKSK